MENEKVLKKISEELISIRKFLEYNKETYTGRFMLGVVSGFGAVIGATIVVALLVYILSKLATIELLRPFIEQIIDIVNRKYQ